MPSGVFYPAAATDTGYWGPSYFYGSGYLDDSAAAGKYNSGSENAWVRFLGVSIPAGATITSAIIRFVSKGAQTTTGVALTACAELSESPAAPVSAADVLSRAKTSGVSWAPGDWAATTIYETPDLATELQSVTEQEAWVSGNAVQIYLLDDGSLTGANRVFYCFGHGSLYPELHVEWTIVTHSPSMNGKGVMLAPSTPISQPPAIAGAGSIESPVAIAGAIIPPLSGTGNLLAPGAVKGVTVQALAGAGGLPAPSARWSVPDDQLPTCQVIYTLTLTGDADGLNNIVIPMDSFQSRLSADAIHYLSASIPNSRAWADAIASRRQGQWIVKKGLLRSEYALRQALLRYEAAAEAEVAAFKSSTFGGWLVAMAASSGLTTTGLLEQYTVPAYWPGADRIVPAMKHILDGDPTNAAFVQWFVQNGYSGSTDFDWREAVRLLQTPAWLSAATGGYYTSWRQLCGLDGGHPYVSSGILDLTDAKDARQAELSALQADPADWSAGGTILAEIIRVDYQSLSWARGSEGDSATITGQSTVSVGASKSVPISGIQYESLDTSGKRRLRCEVSLWLAPGDVATWGGESMVVGEVQHIVSVGEAYMEITEA